MFFPLIIGILSSQGGDFNFNSVLSSPTSKQTSDTTAIISVTINLLNYTE